MFCHKCGAQIEDGSMFCHKCGAKMTYANTDPQDLSAAAVVDESGKSKVERSVQETRTASAQTAIPTESVTDYGVDFKTFVDNHVRKTTKYQSAEELLGSHVPQIFIWICFGIPTVLGFLAGGPLGALLIGLFFGYPAALVTDFFKKITVSGPTEKVDGKIDSDDLIQFLNGYLNYLSPYFNEWRYMKYSGGAGVGGAMVVHTANLNTASAVKIGTGFGRNPKCCVTIWIEPDETVPDSGGMKYYFTTMNAIWPARYACMVKAVPILQAAMEYYLKYGKGGGN